jgi:hypothetical protein
LRRRTVEQRTSKMQSIVAGLDKRENTCQLRPQASVGGNIRLLQIDHLRVVLDERSETLLRAGSDEGNESHLAPEERFKLMSAAV